MVEKIIKVFSAAFALIWCFVIFTEYWRYNPKYSLALDNFQFTGLLLAFLGIGAGLSFWLSQIKKKPVKFVTGLTVFAALLVLDSMTVASFYGKVDALSMDGRGLMLHLGHIIGVAFCIFVVYLSARALGKMVSTIFPFKVAPKDLPVIQVCVGIACLSILLFFFALFGILKIWAVAPLMLLILAADWRSTLQIIKATLFMPLTVTKKMNALGVFSFLFLGAFVIFNFVQILRPFPTGTDSINLYVNLPNLLGDYGKLVAGNQPYYWSLFMSLGSVVFGRVDVILGLSYLGGFLALTALFRLSRKWLDVNYSALVLFLFYSLPMTNFLSYRDMKIDMGLLFISLSILLVFYNYIKPASKATPAAAAKPQNMTDTGKNTKYKKMGKTQVTPQTPVTAAWLLSAKAFFAHHIPAVFKENRLMVLMGFLAGFAFGVKLTILFFFFSLLAAFWYAETGILGFLTAIFLLFGLTFLLGLDAQPGLRDFHDNVPMLQWGLLATGAGLTVYLFIKQQKSAMTILKSSFILCLFFVIPVLPWFGKNFSETNKISVDSLLNGRQATPTMNLNDLEKSLEEQ